VTKKAAGQTSTTHHLETSAEDDGAAGSSSDDKDVHILLERPPDENKNDQHDMDYEVADENQWGY
jgi:hypothetical protein